MRVVRQDVAEQKDVWLTLDCEFISLRMTKFWLSRSAFETFRMKSHKFIFFSTLLLVSASSTDAFRRKDFMERCPLVSETPPPDDTSINSRFPQVKPMRNFQLEKMMGFWNVVQYYSSTEETSEYKCMRGDLEITDAKEVSRALDFSRPFDTSCPTQKSFSLRFNAEKLDHSQMSNLEQLKFAEMWKIAAGTRFGHEWDKERKRN